MNDADGNRRLFTRVPFDAECEVIVADQCIGMQLVDISLKGLLLYHASEAHIEENTLVSVLIKLSNDISISMRTRLNFIHEHFYGFVIHEIDVDSMAHLRKLLELNLGEEEMINRELQALYSGIDQ